MHLDDDDYEVSKAWRLFWSWEMFLSVAPDFISWVWLILSYPLILCTGCLWFKPKKRAISHHCWSIGRRGWTCTGSSWPCPRSGCWGWRAGWQWAPATRWSLPGSPPSSLEVAFSNLKSQTSSLWVCEGLRPLLAPCVRFHFYPNLRVQRSFFGPQLLLKNIITELLFLGQFSFLPHWTFPSIL